MGADHPSFDDAAARVAIDREFGGDHALGPDIFLDPLLESGVETVLWNVSRPQPLAEVVRLLATPAVSHSRKKIELHEIARCPTRSSVHGGNEVETCLRTIVSA